MTVRQMEGAPMVKGCVSILGRSMTRRKPAPGTKGGAFRLRRFAVSTLQPRARYGWFVPKTETHPWSKIGLT